MEGKGEKEGDFSISLDISLYIGGPLSMDLTAEAIRPLLAFQVSLPVAFSQRL
jgi:hypothetical protein